MSDIDRSMIDPADFAQSSAPVLTFSSGLAAGAVIATLRSGRHDSVGGAVFSTFSTVPPQLALSNGRIVKGAAVAVPGTVYGIGIRVEGATGGDSQGCVIKFTAK